MTDVGISALGAGCGKLQNVNLYCCNEVTNVGVSALGLVYVRGSRQNR